MASKWLAQSDNQFAVLQWPTPGLVINANNSRDARSYAKKSSPRFHKLGDLDFRHLRGCGRFAKALLGVP
jgi:hypothetical protein